MIKNNKISSICIITQYYFPETGAPQIRLANMGRVLKSQNVDVSVITTFPSYPDGVLKKPYRRTLRQIETIDDIAITRVFSFIAAGKQKLRRVLSYVSFSFFAIPSVIFSKQPDIFFVEAQPVTLAIPAFLAKIFRGTPYVYNTPDLQVEHAKEDRWVPNFVVYFASHLEGFLMRNSLAVTTVTDSFRDYFVSKYKLKPNRVLMLPNGADTNRLKPIPFDENFYNQLNLGEKKLFFTFAGTHAHYQGLELIIEVAGNDWFEISDKQRREKCKDLGVEISDLMEDYEVTQQVFEKLVEEKTFDPLYVTHVPKELVPLAKQNADDDSLVDVYELIINGQEISPGYSELNDPDIQRKRLLDQAGEETQKVDEEFLMALEHGMPPAGGIGIGIDIKSIGLRVCRT